MKINILAAKSKAIKTFNAQKRRKIPVSCAAVSTGAYQHERYLRKMLEKNSFVMITCAIKERKANSSRRRGVNLKKVKREFSFHFRAVCGIWLMLVRDVKIRPISFPQFRYPFFHQPRPSIPCKHIYCLLTNRNDSSKLTYPF